VAIIKVSRSQHQHPVMNIKPETKLNWALRKKERTVAQAGGRKATN